MREAGAWFDVDTGEPVLAILPLPDLSGLRGALLAAQTAVGMGTYRAASGNRNVSVTFGYRPRKPMMGGQEGCVLTAFNRDHPDVAGYLADYSVAMGGALEAIFPSVVDDGRRAIDQVLPDWRLSTNSLWTSGVINRDSALPYHRDGNNFDAWSVMPVVRSGVRGGHLHIPEYGWTVPCRDGQAVAFFGRRLVHGVTPMRRTTDDSYRISVVFYALRGLKDCHTFAEETAYARRRRAEREDSIALGTVTLPRLNPAPTLPPVGATLDAATLADLVEFARVEATSRDVEPWADLIAALHTQGTLTRPAATWLATLYNTYDDLGSAWACLRRWPSVEGWAAAADREGAAGYPLTQERRALRGGKVLRRLASYADTIAAHPSRTEEGWMGEVLVGDDPGADFARLTTHMRKVWGVGRQSAFEWAEFAAKVIGLGVDAADAQLWESSGPRRCLERIYGLPPDTTPATLDATAAACRDHLAAAGVPLSWVDFETVICDFNVMRSGRYYPGRHLAALRAEIDTVPDPGDRAALDAAWGAVVPPPWNTIPPGIDRGRLAVYRDTGRITTTP